MTVDIVYSEYISHIFLNLFVFTNFQQIKPTPGYVYTSQGTGLLHLLKFQGKYFRMLCWQLTELAKIHMYVHTRSAMTLLKQVICILEMLIKKQEGLHSNMSAIVPGTRSHVIHHDVSHDPTVPQLCTNVSWYSFTKAVHLVLFWAGVIVINDT